MRRTAWLRKDSRRARRRCRLAIRVVSLICGGETYCRRIPGVGAGATCSAAALAATGDLDRRFGNDGKVRTNFSIREDSALAVAIQTPTRIVAAGVADDGRDGTFALARDRAG
jgi:hypothetical protein